MKSAEKGAPRTGAAKAAKATVAARSPSTTASRVGASPSAASLWRGRLPMLLAWLAALVLIVALAAWLALRSPAPAEGPAEAAAVPPAAAASSAAAFPELGIAQLLGGHSDDWRVAHLQGNPSVLVIEFPGLLAQGQAFNRAAALLEKNKASRDQVMGDAQLADLIQRSGDNAETFYQGNDYTNANIARFFSLSAQQKVSLNTQELRLRTLLLKAGMMVEEAGGTYRPQGHQAVISFTATQPDNPTTQPDEGVDAERRKSILLHEISHGEFFTWPEYHAQCWKFWKALTEAERKLFRQYLANLDYDAGNEELMVNETQALLMHTPDTRAFSAQTLGVTEAQLASFRARFKQAAE